MTIEVPADAPFYIHTMVERINDEFNRTVMNPSRPSRLASFNTLGQFPDPADFPQCMAINRADGLVYVSDGAVWSTT